MIGQNERKNSCGWRTQHEPRTGKPGHNNNALVNFGMTAIQKIAAKKPEQGAATSIYLASSPDVAGVTGKYFSDSQETKSSAASYDVAAQQRLWALSEQMVHAKVQA